MVPGLLGLSYLLKKVGASSYILAQNGSLNNLYNQDFYKIWRKVNISDHVFKNIKQEILLENHSVMFS